MLDPPTQNPVVSGYDGSVRYKGDTVTLTCQVSGGSPLATLSWTCDGQPQNVNPSISDPPSAPGIYTSTSTPFPWIEAGQGTLECKSQPGNPPTIKYQWIRENEVIKGETRDRPVINIGTTPAYVHETKSFERPCTADDSPSVEVILSPSSIKEGQDVSLNCLAKGVPDQYIYNVSAVFNSSSTFYSELNRTVEMKIPFLSNPFVTFVVSYKRKDSKENLLSEDILEEENRENYTLLIKNLLPQTEYLFWLFSYNIKGNNTDDLKLEKRRWNVLENKEFGI
ncbi:hypothetical protein KUTeg_006085 [Tegillarca granosa]|uniref:Ig-like domain-containing protein n=1 Tax=Tegillarca granosa TaxID=220873 RepID=A0ABQ9FFH6_TEGGR|nr:hypothetical protein KUTeg_006085 [Tegillarca granosa]